MRVVICLALVDTGLIKYNNNSLSISVNGHGTFRFVLFFVFSKVQLIKIALKFDSAWFKKSDSRLIEI